MSDIDDSPFAAAALNMLTSVIVIPLLLNLRIKVCWDGDSWFYEALQLVDA
jgi:hypothetical protein